MGNNYVSKYFSPFFFCLQWATKRTVTVDRINPEYFRTDETKLYTYLGYPEIRL